MRSRLVCLSRLGDYDIFHALWTPLCSESALIMDNRINGMLSRTYNRQRQNDLCLRTLYLMSRKQNRTKRNETKRKGKRKTKACLLREEIANWLIPVKPYSCIALTDIRPAVGTQLSYWGVQTLVQTVQLRGRVWNDVRCAKRTVPLNEADNLGGG